MTVWNYICNSFSVVMTVDDWINVFDKIQVDTSFVYINCDVLVLLMSYFKVDWQKQRSGSIKIIGGGLEDLFSFKTPEEITHKIQSNLSIPRLIQDWVVQSNLYLLKTNLKKLNYVCYYIATCEL